MGCNVSKFEVLNRAAFVKRLEAVKSRRRRPFSTLSDKELLSHHDHDFSISSHPSNGNKPYFLQDIITNNPPKGIDPPETPTKGHVGIAIIIASHDKYGVVGVVAEEKCAHGDGKKEGLMNAKKEVAFIGLNDDEDNDNENENENEDELDEPRIGYVDDEAFPGSPSFRIYFKDNWEDGTKESDQNDDAFPKMLPNGNYISPSKMSIPCDGVEEIQKVKRVKKKRCFRKVLPKRGSSQTEVKNILKMKSCYS